MNTKWFYNLTAWAYGLLDAIYFNNYNGSPRKAVVDAIRLDNTILDMCTGTAENLFRISDKYETVKLIGVDRSRGMLDVARRKVKKNNIHNIKLYEMDATNMSFKDNCFDKVLLSLVIHETDDELAGKLILEAKRVLKDNGEIVITEWETSKVWWRKVLFAPIALLEPKTYKAFIKKDLDVYFTEFGLEIVETIHCDYTKVLRIKKTV